MPVDLFAQRMSKKDWEREFRRVRDEQRRLREKDAARRRAKWDKMRMDMLRARGHEPSTVS